MKKFNIALLLIVLSAGSLNIAAKPTGKIQINLTAEKRVFQTDFGDDLLLRVVKDSSIKHRNFGWILEVVKKPYRLNSKNLIYTNKTGTTADSSQIYAWQISNAEFPMYRVLKVLGQTQVIKVRLIKPKVEGEGIDAGFVSGRLKISWSHPKQI